MTGNEGKFEVLGNFSNKMLEGKFSYQKIHTLLVSTKFMEGNCSRMITMWLLDILFTSWHLLSALFSQWLGLLSFSGSFACHCSFFCLCLLQGYQESVSGGSYSSCIWLGFHQLACLLSLAPLFLLSWQPFLASLLCRVDMTS